MTILSSEDQVKIVKLFLKKRPMKIHWIQIPKEVRCSLEKLFDEYRLDALVGILESSGDFNIEIEVLSQFKMEKAEVEFIINTMKMGVETNESKQQTCYKIRKHIKKLYGLLPPPKLSKILKVPLLLLLEMSPQNKKKIVSKTDHKVKSSTSSKDVTNRINNTAPMIEINDTQELSELNQMLARHSNKTQKKYSNSEKKLILKLVDRFGSKLVHEQVRVSYDTIARFLRHRERGYIVPSTKATFMPVIDTMKKFPGMGPMQIRDYNHRHFGISMGVNTVRKVMEDNGWYPSYSRKVVITEEPRRYDAIRRNYMWHLDFKHFYINKCKVYLLFIEDDCSRFIVGHELSDAERVDVVIESISKSITLHGKPETVMSDGGSAFYSWRGISKLTKFLEEFGIDQIVAKIPRVNGKVESLNQKIEKELIFTQNFSSLNNFESELIEWIGLYNYRRPHQGLGNLQVPADKYYPGAAKWFKESNKDGSSGILDALSILLKEFKKSV